VAGDNWVRMIKGTPSVQVIVEYLELWEVVHRETVVDGVPDSVAWRLTVNWFTPPSLHMPCSSWDGR
jgi:hypothetical protein